MHLAEVDMFFTDQLNRTVSINNFPQRIISLVPSQTELLCDLGLKEKIIGVTKFCVHPSGINKTKTIVGGTKNLRMDVIENLQPDIIIANKEENEKEQLEILAEKFPVWVSDIKNLDDAFQMIQLLGAITNTNEGARTILENIITAKNDYSSQVTKNTFRTIYLIWKNPYMCVGGDTFISSMLFAAGFENTTAHYSRYPEITIAEIAELKPEIIILSSEPFPFKEIDCTELQLKLPQTKIILADGEMLSWYGSRMQYCWQYFTTLRQQLSV